MRGEVQDPRAVEERRESFVCWLPFWVGAVLLLTLNLGYSPLAGSESRWAIITREMFQTGDFFHPTINAEPYFDKPLLTYWMTAAAALVNGGKVTELIVRIPSVAAGLAALASLIALARQMFNRKTALTAGWLMLGCYSFAFWGRLAEADMANLAFCTAAAAWYVHCRDRAGYGSYAVFFLICGIGAHAKGMAAFAVPCLVVIADLIAAKTWKKHFGNWKLYAGLLTGLAAYAVPFILSSVTVPAVPVPHVSDTGIALAVRENIVRFFRPFDHVEPFYAYLIHVPRQLAVWAPLSLFAFFAVLFRWKREGRQEKMLLLSVILIFLFFSASGSKRHYYIMPILPYFLTLAAAFLNRVEENPKLEKAKQILLRVYRIVPITAAFLAALLFALAAWFPRLCPVPVPSRVLLYIAGALFIGFLAMVFSSLLIRARKYEESSLRPAPAVLSVLVPVFFAHLFLFGYVMPAISTMRTLRPSVQRMRAFLNVPGLPPGSLVFLEKTYNDTFFYLDPPQPIPVARAKDLASAKGGCFVIGERRQFEKLTPYLLKDLPLIAEESHSGTERGKFGKKIQLRYRKRSLP